MPPRLPTRLLPRLVRPTTFRTPLRHYTTPPTTTPPKTLSQRLKSLSKEYGYSALGVYFAISALDFPICFLGVRLIGPERIGEYEHAAMHYIRPVINGARAMVGIPKTVAVADPADEVVEVPKEEKKAASIWTELALAYAIHKSLIFIRVPITAAVTPKVVKMLRSWGFEIGKKGGIRAGLPTGKGGKSVVDRKK